VVAESPQGTPGLLPLSWIEESDCFGFFPGETWQGKTWLEQNKIVCDRNGGLRDLLAHCPDSYHLRYLSGVPGVAAGEQREDEVGYLFQPPRYGYDLANYWREFSHKSAKNLRREVAALEKAGVSYRHDEPRDFDWMVELNLERFGERSYFHDQRFKEGFRSLVRLLCEKGWLRVTTVLIDREPAAVDVGCVYRGAYTLLAGGTSGKVPGVAKLINLQHLGRACRERFDQVDFLCGDFNWKKLFHLTPRPLYLLTNVPADRVRENKTPETTRPNAAADPFPAREHASA